MIATEAMEAERAANLARREAGARGREAGDRSPPAACRRCGAAPPEARFRQNRRGYWHHVCADCESKAASARVKALAGEARDRHAAYRAAYDERRRAERAADPTPQRARRPTSRTTASPRPKPPKPASPPAVVEEPVYVSRVPGLRERLKAKRLREQET